MSDIAHKLAFLLERLPITIAMLDASGLIVGKFGQLSDILGVRTPSRDSETRWRWQFTDRTGAPISAENWPDALALRGELPPSSVIARHEQDGVRLIKVTAVPMADMQGDIAAVALFHQVDLAGRSADGSHSDLEHRLVEALKAALDPN